MSSDAPLASASRRVVRTTGGEALAFLAVLSSIARANDDVIAIDETPGWLSVVCGLARVRLRSARRASVFDAIGEHTRALVLRSTDVELIQDLAELGPTLVVLADHAIGARSCAVITSGETHTTLTLDGDVAAQGDAIERTLSTLARDARTLGG